MTEHEKKEFNKAEPTSDDSAIPHKRLRPEFTEPFVKTAGLSLQHSFIWKSSFKPLLAEKSGN